jgi:hypothetical protein
MKHRKIGISMKTAQECSLLSLDVHITAAQNCARAINRKILSGFHRSNYMWDFIETSQE